LLQQLDDAGVQLAGIELFNEIGNPAFNGDIAINGPRGGYLIGFEDLLDPAYADVGRGYRNYIRVLAALKEIRDGLTINKLTPIISAGLNTPGDAPEGAKLNVSEDEVSLKGVLTFLRANGLDDYVDQYGVHSYILWAGNSASNIHHLNFSAHYGVRHQARRRKGVGHAGRGRLPRQRCGPPDPVQSLAG